MEMLFAGSLESHNCCSFLSPLHLPPTAPFSCWVFCWGSTVQESCEEWGEGQGGEEKGEGGEGWEQESDPSSQRRIWGGAGLCALVSDPDHSSHSVSSTNEAGDPATEPGHLLLGTVAVPVHPAKVSVWGGDLVRVFYPQGSDYESL